MRHILFHTCAIAGALLAGACSAPVPSSSSSSFVMAEDSLAFENFAYGYNESRLDEALLQRMFGDAVCVKGSSPCSLTPRARAWMNKANDSMTGGRCEGFAVLAALMSSGDVDPETFGGVNARSLKLAGNRDLQRELAYWFSTQMLADTVAEQTKTFSANDVMPFLAQILKSGAPELYRIGMVKKVGNKISGGHAVTPISYYQGDTAGVYLLRVYDNNNPDTERTITIDTNANRWEYDAARRPSQKSSLYFGDSTNDNKLYFAPVRKRLGVLPCPFCSDNKVSVQTRGGVEPVVKSGSSTVGVQSGDAVGTSQGSVLPTFSADLADEPAAFVITAPAGKQFDIDLRGDEGEGNSWDISAFGATFTVSANGQKLSTTTVDSLRIGSEGTNVKYTNASGTPLTLATQVTLQNGSTVELSATLNGASTSVEANVDPMTGDIDVDTQGAEGSSVTVAVSQTSDDGDVQSGQLTYKATDDSQLSISGDVWADGGVLTGSLDDGSGTTTPLTDGCIDGEQSGMETDVDCGGVCMTKCELSQSCSTGNDCESKFCHAVTHLCVASACEDGALNGSETDVDCGGTTCAACPVGKACVTSADCGGAACVNLVCAQVFAIGGTVNGLPAGMSVVLQNNGADDTTVFGNTSFQFNTKLRGAYAVTVSMQPSLANCTIGNGTGTATADVSDVTVTCTPLYSIGGNVSGLLAGNTVVLQNNAADNLPVIANGTFAFPTPVSGAYAVTVLTQPAGGLCQVASGTGTASANVSTVTVTCSAGFTIGGNVSGLPDGGTLVLQDNAADNLSITANGAFTFSTPVLGAYAVTVLTQPAGTMCSVASGTGTATTNVTGVAVTCAPVHSIGGSVSGLPDGGTLVLQNNATDNLSVTANGAFTFATPVLSAYAVTVLTQPAGAFCEVTSGSGTATANVTGVSVSCSTQVAYSGNFVALTGATTQQCTDYNTWRTALTGPFAAMTVRGTFDSTGITCADGTATTQLANAIATDTSLQVVCGAHNWNYCANAAAAPHVLWLDSPNSNPCDVNDCPNPGYMLRPCITAEPLSWGGVNTRTCYEFIGNISPPTQTIEVLFNR